MQTHEEVDEMRRSDARTSLPQDLERDPVAHSAQQRLGEDVGMKHLDMPIRLHTDSSAAKSFASRRGLDRARHVDEEPLVAGGGEK